MKKKELLDANPLPGVLDDEVYKFLRSKNLISDEMLRDFYIRLEYNKWREAGVDIMQCLMIIQREHSELSLEDIKKIIYRRKPETQFIG